MTEPRDRIAVINGLRGIAILAIVFHHLFARFFEAGSGSVEFAGHTLLLGAPLTNGWLAVNLFFILSGFVLFAPYHAGQRQMRSARDARDFLLRRARRLLPLYYLVSVISFLFMLPAQGKHLSDFLLMLTGTFNFVPATFFPKYNWVLWSLGVEIWFSLVFPLLVLAYARIGMARLLLSALLLSLTVRLAAHSIPGVYAGNLVLNAFKDSFVGRLDDFVLGMAAVCLYHRTRDRRLPGAIPSLSFVAGLALLLLTASAWNAIHLGSLSRSAIPFLNNLFQVGCLLGLFGLLWTRNPLLRAAFTNRPLQLLGMMCYSLYVWHGIAIRKVIGGDFSPERVAAYALVLLTLSALTYRFVEFGAVRDAKTLFTPPST